MGLPNRWLVDFDSTLNRLDEAMVAACNAQFGTKYAADDLDHWWWWNERPPEHRDFVWGANVFHNRAWTLNDLGARNDAQRFLDDVILHSSDIPVIVTDRNPYMSEWVHTWLGKRCNLDLPIVTSTSKGSFDATKQGVAHWLSLSTVVEDAPHHAEVFALDPYIRRVYLIDRPYNRDVSHPKVYRVTSLNEIRQMEGWM